MHYTFPLSVVMCKFECALAHTDKGGLLEGLSECSCVCCVNKLYSHISAKKIYVPVVTARSPPIIDWKYFSRCEFCDGSVADEAASRTLKIYTLAVYFLHRIIILWCPTIDISLLLTSAVQRCFFTIKNFAVCLKNPTMTTYLQDKSLRH